MYCFQSEGCPLAFSWRYQVNSSLFEQQRSLKDMRRVNEGIVLVTWYGKELKIERNQKHFDFNTCLVSRIPFDDVCTG